MASQILRPQTLLALGLLALTGPLLGPPQAFADRDAADSSGIELIQPNPDRLVLIEPGPVVPSVLYEDGSIVEMETQSVWRYMCGSDTSNLTIDDLRAAAVRAHETFDDNRDTWTLSGEPRAGLNIIWDVGSGVSAEARDALEMAAVYVENQFADPVTVTINISMYDMGDPYTLGWTQSVYAGYPSWNTTRNGLIGGMDADDTIQNHLPSGSTIPVRYNGASDTVSNENRCFFTRANYNATIGSQSGDAATMAFNTGFSWDFDPSNGVPSYKMCFVSVAIHEVGHALGFTSAADFRSYDIEALDIFRFQRTDGTSDYNPDTEAEFQTTPRTVDKDVPPDDANSDLISAEYRMSDGTPYQCSHFRQQYPSIGIMQPAQGYGPAYYPDYFSDADAAMFDAIGWDYPALPAPGLPPFPDGVRKNRYISFLPNNGELIVAFQIVMTAGPGDTGVMGWAGEPNGDGVSRVIGDPYFTDAWPGVVQVGDCPIAPVAEYEVRATTDGVSFYGALETGTIALPGGKWWADIVGDKVGGFWLAPDGEVNMGDVQAAIQRFEDQPGAPPWTWVDVAEEVPDLVVNFTDIQFIVFAFEGAEYPYKDPSDCP